MAHDFHIASGDDEIVSFRHPLRLNLVAALGHVTPRRLGEGFVYVDHDCGDGVHLAALAAALPRGRFIGVHGETEAVAEGAALAKAAGLGNLEFVPQRAKLGLPACDMLVLGDRFGDADAAERGRLVKGAADCLKPSGLLCLTYRVEAGWAAALPLLDALRAYTAAMSADSILKAEAAVSYARFLRQAEVPWFRDHPVLGAFVDQLTALDSAVVARLLYDAPPHPLAFSTVADLLSASGLSFLGNAELYLNFADLAVPAAAQAALDSLGSREDFETQGDVLRGQAVRRDLFVKGGPDLGVAQRRKVLAATPFTAVTAANAVRREAEFGPFRMGYEAPVFAALIETLAQSSPSAEELWADPKFSQVPPDHVVDGLCFLAANGQVVPLSESLPMAGAAAEMVRFSDFNRTVLERRLFAAPTLPMVGAGGVIIDLSHGEAAILAALADEPAAEASARLLEILQAAGQAVSVGGTAIDNPVLQRAMLDSRIETFRQTRLPVLLRLGVVTAA